MNSPPLLHPPTLAIKVDATRAAMGRRAAQDVADAIRACLMAQPKVRMIFAAAPSQQEMLEALAQAPDIDWSRVEAFHMDEYIGLPADAPQRFAQWLKRHFFARVGITQLHLIAPDADAEAVAKDYADRLAEAPIDIVCLGIGTNGHLAFNDPPADLDDPLDVKVVTLDEACRQQQVDDDCFDRFDQVPRQAITLTVPRLLRASRLFCVVPGQSKRAAVAEAIHGPISGDCPASALKLHPDCTLYLDREAFPDVD